MMDPLLNSCRTPVWYPRLAAFSLPTSFVALRPNEVNALSEGAKATSPEAKDVLDRLDEVIRNFPYYRFISVDLAAPVDTERFRLKRGAICSAKSAWEVLASSERVRASAKREEVTCICVRPYRRMDPAKEFRLFIKNGNLFAMSQYWLTQHFPKAQKEVATYWEKASYFIGANAWALPLQDVCMDVYFTSSGRILITDLNPLGKPTDPLMFNDWKNFDWNGEPVGPKIVPPPHKVSGSVNVSF